MNTNNNKYASPACRCLAGPSRPIFVCSSISKEDKARLLFLRGGCPAQPSPAQPSPAQPHKKKTKKIIQQHTGQVRRQQRTRNIIWTEKKNIWKRERGKTKDERVTAPSFGVARRHSTPETSRKRSPDSVDRTKRRRRRRRRSKRCRKAKQKTLSLFFPWPSNHSSRTGRIFVLATSLVAARLFRVGSFWVSSQSRGLLARPITLVWKEGKSNCSISCLDEWRLFKNSRVSRLWNALHLIRVDLILFFFARDFLRAPQLTYLV